MIKLNESSYPYDREKYLLVSDLESFSYDNNMKVLDRELSDIYHQAKDCDGWMDVAKKYPKVLDKAYKLALEYKDNPRSKFGKDED